MKMGIIDWSGHLLIARRDLVAVKFAKVAFREGQQPRGGRFFTVKTARFASVVQKCGQPEIYLALMEPAKDRTLQSAVKDQRVMTVSQESVGTKADRGEVGFKPGRSRQFLVFPKSLRAFAGRTVVGIKYDLVESPDIPKSERAAPPRAPKKPKPKKPAPVKEKPAGVAYEKVVAFKPAPPDEEDEDEEVTELKQHIRKAIGLLEDGKAVAAFNLLNRAVGG